ncbi:MAG: N-acetylneuraminate synthase [Planctomycetes bacterium]|nr:N-acetylneuraminate synthase [Planctomycetota bacterium]
MPILFLIPARGSSKGFPGKNLALLSGIPLVGHTVRTALAAARTLSGSRVVCSTDDASIAQVAQEWGAEVPFIRPASLATDEAKSLDVVLHALEVIGDEFEAVILLQPTSPLTEPRDVLGAVELFRHTGGPVVSVCQAEHPPAWYFRLDNKRVMMPILPGSGAYQKPMIEPSYRPNGAIYIASLAQIRKGGFWMPETRGFIMPAERSVDVDIAADLEIAKTFLSSRLVPYIEIAGRKVGPNQPCFIIAEAGVNHNGSVELAMRLVDAAASIGADAVKFQTFLADRLVTRNAPKAAYQKEPTGNDESQYDMLRRLELDEGAYRTLKEYSEDRGLVFLSTPFEEASADCLEALDIAAYKLPSGELTNLPFLTHVARKGRPILMSTGMATMDEVSRAVEAVKGAGCKELALLQCVSAYPADPTDANLTAMANLACAFGVPVGYSDHTLGIEVALAAVALGACILEKHFTLDRSLPGPDHRASVEPEELTALVAGVRKVEVARGDGVKRPVNSELETARVARKSLVATRFIPAGTLLNQTFVTARRPGTGMAPDRVEELLDRKALFDISEGTLLTREMFE